MYIHIIISITNFVIRPENHNVENRDNPLQDLNIRDILVISAPKARETKRKTNQWDYKNKTCKQAPKIDRQTYKPSS